jgi:predicted nuclease of restriction endonuclease-like (RecB) superfamily
MVQQIEKRLYQRQGAALNNFTATLPNPQSDLARETLKNPYVFDFLEIASEMQERDLEKALLQHLKKFMLELGRGFAYVGNQFNLNVGGDDYFLDLLFYNFHLHCFVVFELKIGDFKPEFADKLNFYINTVNEQINSVGDKPTIGVLLCKTPNETVVKYALKGIDAPMGVSEYYLGGDYQVTDALPTDLQSELPTIEALEQELSREVEEIKAPLEQKLDQFKELLAKTKREEVQKERDKDDVRYLFNEVIQHLKSEISKNLVDVAKKFTRVELGLIINTTSNALYMEPDLEAQLIKGEAITTLGLRLRMEGFKKGGVDAFGIWKDILIELERFKYGVGTGHNQTWFENLYHQKWTSEEIKGLADKWCDEVMEVLVERLEKLH